MSLCCFVNKIKNVIVVYKEPEIMFQEIWIDLIHCSSFLLTVFG